MDWWRAWHGLPNDPKLAVVAARCKVRRGEVLEVWVALLDYASQNHPRGSVEGFDCEQAGWMLELEPNTVENIVETLRERGLITGEAFLGAWDKRNPKREDDSTERVQRFRQAQREVKRSETQGNAEKRSATNCNAPDKIRGEEIRREKTSAAEKLSAQVEEPLMQQQGGVQKIRVPLPPPVEPQSPPPLPAASDYPETLKACRSHDAGVSPIFASQIVQESIQAALSDAQASKYIGKITDTAIAAAIHESYKTGPPGHRSGLLLRRVPAIIVSWCQEDN